MRARAIVGLTVAATIAMCGIARANGIAAFVKPQSDSPVELLSCSAGLQYVNSGYGTDFYRLSMGTRFKNLSSKNAVAVLIHFQLANAFGDVIDDVFGESSGTFSPNVEIDGQKWSNTDTWPGLGIIRCSVSRVLFDDGSVWRDPAGPGSSAPPRRQLLPGGSDL